MPEALQVLGEGGVFGLVIHGYEYPEAVETSDANWLSCAVSAQVVGFECRLLVALTTFDLARFTSELRAALDEFGRSAKLTGDESQIAVTAIIEKTGRARVEGEIVSRGQPGGKLKFNFDTDQTYLRRTLAEADRIVNAYPPRGND